MRITVLGINYAPELTGIAPYNQGLCEYLHQCGHQVEMVTTFAYYPAWKKAAADARRLFRTDTLGQIRVHRCWHYVPAKVSALKRILHEATFVGTSFLRLLSLPTPDVYVVVSPPLLLGLAVWLLTWFRHAPFIFHVQDLQPDAAMALGMLKPSTFTRLLYWFEAMAYRKAAGVSGISQGMLDAFSRKGVEPERQIYFPNPVQVPALAEFPVVGAFRARNGFKAGDFLAVYSGNLGIKQGLDILVEAAYQVQKSALPIKIVICGDGAARPAIEAAMRARGSFCISLLPLQPVAQYRELLVDADVCLITQQAGSGAAFFPSKLLATLAYARPIVGVADDASELSHAINAGRFGECVQPGAASRLAEILCQMAADRSKLAHYGRAGREYVAQFDSQRVLSHFESDLCRLGNKASRFRSQV